MFRIEHMAHHAHAQDPEKERIPMAETFRCYVHYATGIPSLRLKLWRLVHRPRGRIGEGEKGYVPAGRVPELRRDARIYLGVYALVAVVSLWLQTWAAAVYWLLPAILGEPFQRMIRIAERTGCALGPDMLRNTRTTLAGAPLRWLNWNMAFHALPRLHALLAPRLVHVSRGYLGVQRDVIRRVPAGTRWILTLRRRSW